jgi:hypothetical protein
MIAAALRANRPRDAMTSRFEDLRGRRNIVSVVTKMLEHTCPDPVGSLDHVPADKFTVFISRANPEGRADTLLLHETTRLPPAPALGAKGDFKPQHIKEAGKTADLKDYFRQRRSFRNPFFTHEFPTRFEVLHPQSLFPSGGVVVMTRWANCRHNFLFQVTVLIPTIAILTFGQIPNGSLGGTVLDESEAVIPNAKVTVTNQDTAFQRSVTSGKDGMFLVAGLTPGPNEVRAEAK